METILAALQEANPGARAPSRVTKTALRALRLDALRSLLSRLSADTRGQKEVLVERALRLGSVDAKAAAEQAAVERAAAEVKEGCACWTCRLSALHCPAPRRTSTLWQSQACHGPTALPRHAAKQAGEPAAGG